jgi:hypothetical protein
MGSKASGMRVCVWLARCNWQQGQHVSNASTHSAAAPLQHTTPRSERCPAACLASRGNGGGATQTVHPPSQPAVRQAVKSSEGWATCCFRQAPSYQGTQRSSRASCYEPKPAAAAASQLSTLHTNPSLNTENCPACAAHLEAWVVPHAALALAPVEKLVLAVEEVIRRVLSSKHTPGEGLQGAGAVQRGGGIRVLQAHSGRQPHSGGMAADGHRLTSTRGWCRAIVHQGMPTFGFGGTSIGPGEQPAHQPADE